MIAQMVSNVVVYRSENFDWLRNRFVIDVGVEMSRHLDTYSRRFAYDDDSRNPLDDMFYKLFMSCEVPNSSILVDSYLNRGLLILKEDMYLQFYNSVARDKLLSSFIERFASEDL